MTLLDVALKAHRAGFCVMPPKDDGSKMPDAVSWKDYQLTPSTEEEIRTWYSLERGGIGVICGATSGYLEVMEFEGRAVAEGLWEEYKKQAEASELMPLLSRVTQGYGARSPSGGIHLAWRCPEGIAGNTKLAERVATDEELGKDPSEKRKTLIETRGEGGYIVTPPSNGRVHPSGLPYTWLAGGFESVATITGEERAALLELARSFDQIFRPEFGTPKGESKTSDEDRPGDDFNARADWSRDILGPAGWSLTGHHGGREHWYRKSDGKRGWTSATITPDDRYLYVFSTAADLPTLEGLSKFRAYALLHHNADFSAAASELKSQGYGIPEEIPVIGGAVPAPSPGPPPTSPTPTPTPGNGQHAEQDSPPNVLGPALSLEPWPKLPAQPAFYGLAGEVVKIATPYTEGDPVAVLGQFLALFGVAAGPNPHFQVGATRHTARVFVGIVGKSAKARKGDSWMPVEHLFIAADRSLTPRIMSGFGSGEAMVREVRDPQFTDTKEGPKEVDPGVLDKRLMILETEFARLLVAMGREGSTISQHIRDAFDGRPLANRVKTNAAIATGHHIGIIGHTTAEELRGRLTEDQIRNGFANRFLWLAVRRAQLLPSPPSFEGKEIDDLTHVVWTQLRQAKDVGRMQRSAAAEKLWAEIYEEVSREERGVVGALIERGEALILRLSMVYALTDGSEEVTPIHLDAAYALWDYGRRSVGHLFGGTTGEVLADRILEALADGPMTSSRITKEVFGNNINALQLHKALDLLVTRGLANSQRVKTSEGPGRPATIWFRPS